MRHTMNRTVYQPSPMCGCKNGVMPVPKMPCAHAANSMARTIIPGCAEQVQHTAGAMPTPCDCVLAMAYVHVQTWGNLYDPCTALIAGTLFPDLDKPFCGETVSASAYPSPPARTCDCALPARRDSGMGCGMRGGVCRD